MSRFLIFDIFNKKPGIFLIHAFIHDQDFLADQSAILEIIIIDLPVAVLKEDFSADGIVFADIVEIVLITRDNFHRKAVINRIDLEDSSLSVELGIRRSDQEFPVSVPIKVLVDISQILRALQP